MPVVEARKENLPSILGAVEPLHAFLQHEALDLAVMGVGLGPDDKHVGEWASW